VIRPREVASHVALFPARTPTLLPATHTNSYALGSRDLLLVEPATPHRDERAEWLSWARGLVSMGHRLTGVLATHHHEDHVGGAELFSRELGVPLIAHPETASRLAANVGKTVVDGDSIVLDGPVPQRWDVLHTPGHAPGHVCLLERESGTLVVGDMVASVGTILIAPGDGNMAEYLRQLERLRGLEARVALPAHGEPIESPSALFAHYVAHRLQREQKVLDAVGAAGDEGETSGELVPRVYADVSPAIWPIALLSLQAHLDKLVEDGRIQTKDDRYSLARGT
jgi:endoribonuclease LACTB2